MNLSSTSLHTTKRKKQILKKEYFNDLLIPLICILCILPFIIYLKEYDTGYSKYLWSSSNSYVTDIYCYYRSLFFVGTCFIALAILCFRFSLYKELTRSMKLFVPMIIYACGVILSTVFSINITASLRGNNFQFQTCFVLLGYIIACIYTYQITVSEQDFNSILRAIIIVTCLLCITGIFQIFKCDLLNFDIFQKIIMSDTDYELYAGNIDTVFTGNDVFLTLFNPNDAGVYLTMFFFFLLVPALNERTRVKQFMYAVLLIVILILILYTYTRMALASLILTSILYLICLRHNVASRKLKYIIPILSILIVVLIGIDATNNWHYIKRSIDKKNTSLLTSIRTTSDGIYINYDGSDIRLYITEDSSLLIEQDGILMPGKLLDDGSIKLPLDENSCASLYTCDEFTEIHTQLENYFFQFILNSSGYHYINDKGQIDDIVSVDCLDLHGLEYLASGRGYIWSRTIPLLKKYILFGSGPDTFTEAYPQNDYIGKFLYADRTDRIVEKAHNNWLNEWVQIGAIATLSHLIFLVLYFNRCRALFSHNSNGTVSLLLGKGAFLGNISYLICSFFHDDSLFTTPVFWIFAGLSLSALYISEHATMSK